MRRTVLAFTGLVACLAAFRRVEAASPAPWTQVSLASFRGDSAAVLKRAQRAQSSFETSRRSHLPPAPGSPASQCDLQVGRFCYTHDDGHVKPKAEPPVIAGFRGRLLATLDSAAAATPGDPWIAGQRVRYHVEARDHRRALAAARECRAAPWWCSALAGFVLHVDSQPAAADSAYSDALARMSADERCRWTDVSDFLDGRAAGAWKRSRCDGPLGTSARDSIAERFWWLSRPFLSRPTNDRRTEHFARRTMSRIESMATAGYDVRWGADTDELILRFGWPTAWGRHLPTVGLMASPTIVGWEPTPSFHFVPEGRSLDAAVPALRDDMWSPRLRAAPERYAPTYAAQVLPLRAQVAVFRRGADALLVAAAKLPGDSLLRDDSLTVALAATSGPSDAPRVSTRRGADSALALTVPWRDALVGVEAFAPARRAAARFRSGHAMPHIDGRLAVSDLLLYDAARATSPTALDHVLGAMLGDTRATPGQRIGVLWETYGLSASGETVDVSLEVQRVRASWTTRAAERLRLATAARPVRVRWAESPDRQSGAAVRALALDLSHLSAGTYEVRLRVTAADGATASTVRELEVER